MLIIRGLLILVCGAFALLLAIVQLKSPGLNPGLIIFAGVFASLVLILGPFWPNSKRIERLKALLDRALGIKNAIGVIGFALFGVIAIVIAWDRYANPVREWGRLENIVVAVAGPRGVPIAWAVFSLYFFWKAFDLYRKAGRSRNEAA